MKKCCFAVTVLLILSMILIGCRGPDTEGKTYTIRYYANAPTISGFPPEDTKSYVSGEPATVLGKNTLVYDGHKFLYWNTKTDDTGDTYHPGDTITVKNINIHLYAIWGVLP
jgi:hypothetical protein